MLRSLALVLLLPLAACGTTSDAAPAAPTAKVQKASTGSLQTVCVDVMTKARTCTDQYIPALVDARARQDNPAGIKAKVAADRDGVIAEARSEWAVDSTNEAIATMCQRLSSAPDATQADADAGQACLAHEDCATFVSCITPVFEKHLSK